MPRKNIFINPALFLLSFCFCLLLIELVFPLVLNKVPFKLYANLDRGVWPFAQSSKRSVIPRDYIALVGDSYAAGAGDWGKHELEHAGLSTPDYQSAHLLYRKLGIDVVTFLVPSDLIFPRSREACRMIESATLAQNIEFMDATGFIRKASLSETVHGPEDWQHFNKKGQDVLSDAILTAFFDLEKSYNRYGCDLP